jgi:hypothetical protein
MRFYLAAIPAICFLTPGFLLSESPLKLPSVSIGNNLEAPVKITLEEPAPDEGLEITVHSADAKLLRISAAADKPGAETAVIKVRPGNLQSQEFWLQGFGSSGAVKYTAKAPQRGEGAGEVALAPSGILIIGPYRVPKFPTTTGATPARIMVNAARLDSSLKFVEQQAVSSDLKLTVSNSNPSAGLLTDASITIPAGESSFQTTFRPAGGEGDATFAITPPAGFSAPAEFASVTASVRKPGLGLSDEVIVGENLEALGAVSLGEAPPADGVTVTLTSSDPSRLLLSNAATELGSKSIQVKIPPNKVANQFFIQALGKSGEVEYTATVPGYRARTGVVKLVPSGITLTPYFQGPPDEGQVLKADKTGEGSHGFLIKESERTPMKLVAWTAWLDPQTHRSADITVQPLRGGLSLTIPLTNSNPAAGKIPASITIAGGSDNGFVEFTPASAGTTEIAVVTPGNFTVSANSTKVIGTVKK